MSYSIFEVWENSLLPGNNGLYRVEKFLGEGTFGKVAKCIDITTNQEVAVKILKNEYKNAGRDEIKALIEVSKIDSDTYCLVKCIDWFRYKSHICIVFEMLDQSLYDFMEDRKYLPLDLVEIRAIAWQLLIALQGLKNINLVHCDIKLDNIMLVNQASEPFGVKLIDFGLAEKTSDLQTGTHMQNIRFRAPEVMLGLPLDERLDMWTVGYVLAILYAGVHIHPKDSEYDIIRALVNMHGMPDNELLERGLFTNKFFTQTEKNSKIVWQLDTPRQQSKKTGKQVKGHIKYVTFDNLKDAYFDATKRDEVEQFIDLLEQMLEVDPNKRISPSEAFKHPFFTMKIAQTSAGSKETKPEEPEAPKVHKQPHTKNVPQEPEIVPQETFKTAKEKHFIHQQKDSKGKTRAAPLKRKHDDRQNQNPAESSQTEAVAKKRKRDDRQNQNPAESFQAKPAVKKRKRC